METIDESADRGRYKNDIEILITRLQRISRQDDYRTFFQGYARPDLERFGEALDARVDELNSMIRQARNGSAE